MPAPPAHPAPGSPPPFPPFPVERSERLYASPWCGLRRDHLRLPDGGVQEHHVVEIGDAVAVVPVLPDGRLLLVWQYRHPHGRTHWEVPAGRLQGGERPADAAARELREETGHAPGRLVELPGFFPINGISDHWCHLFVAQDCQPRGQRQLDRAELLAHHALPREEVVALLRGGRLQDGFTALALFYFLSWEQHAR